MTSINRYADPFSGVYEKLHPLLLSSKESSCDNPTYHQAVNGSDADGYLEAMYLKFETFNKTMKAYKILERTKTMHVLLSTWAVKCKRYPNGLIRKFKARFCVRGDKEIEGVDFFETFAPVVQWVTIRLLLILSGHMNLSTIQVDYTSAFLHAELNVG